MKINNQKLVSYSTIPHFIEHFTRKMKIKKASLFFGAGISKDSGFPCWDEVLKPYSESLNLNWQFEKNDLPLIAQFAYDSEPMHFNDNTQRIFSKPSKENKIIDSFISLPVDNIWTTNFETSIENSCERKIREKALKSYHVFGLDEDNTTLNTFEKNIYKINGTIANNASNYIFVKEDFYRHRNKQNKYLSLLQKKLQENSFLFYGYSFSDDIVLNEISKLKYQLEIPTDKLPIHYRFVAAKNIESNEEISHINYYSEYLNKYYNIKTIIIPSYDVMSNILSNLMKLFYIDNIYISGAISNFDQLSEKTVQEFTSTLSKKLIANNYKIYSGYGRGVGSALLKGAIDHVSLDFYDRLSEVISLNPFPYEFQDFSDKDKNQYRYFIQKQCGVSIFIFGNKIEKEGNLTGMIEELKIASNLNHFVIPIPQTGFTSKFLYDKIFQQDTEFANIPFQHMASFKTNNNLSENTDEIIDDLIMVLQKIRRNLINFSFDEI